MDIHKRKGIIEIKRTLFNELGHEEYEALFSKFYPVHIDYNSLTDIFTYSGFSPLFSSINDFDYPPKYEVIMTRHRSGVIVEFRMYNDVITSKINKPKKVRYYINHEIIEQPITEESIKCDHEIIQSKYKIYDTQYRYCKHCGILAHEDGDFSYLCGSPWCRCSE